jgi:hypothetical protein
MLNQRFGEDSDFPCGVLTGRPHHKHAARRNRIARHNLNKCAGIQIAVDEMIRKPSDAKPRSLRETISNPLERIHIGGDGPPPIEWLKSGRFAFP